MFKSDLMTAKCNLVKNHAFRVNSYFVGRLNLKLLQVTLTQFYFLLFLFIIIFVFSFTDVA